MARVVNAFDFTVLLIPHASIHERGMNHAFADPAKAGPDFTDRGGMEG